MIDFEQGEYVVYEVRRHWFVFLARVSIIFILILAPLVAYEFGGAFIPELLSLFTISFSGNVQALFAFLYTLWLLFLWTSFFVVWTDYYLDVWLITNHRIVDIDQKGLFHREISSFRLDNIQDITIEIRGILGTLLKFGNIQVETASENRMFIIQTAAHPELIKKIITDEQSKAIERLKTKAVTSL